MLILAQLDGSVELARSIGADTVELDLSIPFTAARARNEGFAHLLQLVPDIKFVQFVDSDCQIVDGWIERAESELAAKPDVAAVCRPQARTIPCCQHLQSSVRHQVGYPGRRSPSLRWRFHWLKETQSAWLWGLV